MSGKRFLDASWAESTLPVGWFAFVFSLWARAWIRSRLDEVAVRIQAEQRRRR
jgi:hypothetical protein